MKIKEYEAFLKKISSRIGELKNFSDYKDFENDWNDYFQNIYKKYSNNTLPPRIFIAESAPNGCYTNNPYIFHKASLSKKLCHKIDMYLWRYYTGVFPNSSSHQTKILTKKEALIELSKNNILILDLLPTHGIKLKSGERKNINTKLLHLTNLILLKSLYSYTDITINYAFSVPPSLYTIGMASIYLSPNFIEFGNVNTGQGHAPSSKSIQDIIKRGF